MQVFNYLVSVLIYAGLLSLAKSFCGLNLTYIQIASLAVVAPPFATLIVSLGTLLILLFLFIIASVLEIFQAINDRVKAFLENTKKQKGQNK
jgi:hypothetical protein